MPDLHSFEPYAFTDIHTKVAEALVQEGAQVFDTLPLFSGERGSDYWVAPDDPHPNTAAHRLIGDYLGDVLGEYFD